MDGKPLKFDKMIFSLCLAQFSISKERKKNIDKACFFLEKAGREKADLLLLPELFEFPYFPKRKDDAFFKWASKLEEHPYLDVLQKQCRSSNVALLFSFFERYRSKFFNSCVLIFKDGRIGKIYRKMHIPSGVGYEEKYYFEAGHDFVVENLQAGVPVGLGICWDQWFPEHARVLSLKQAEIILYPSAIGSEPHRPGYNSREHWQKVMQGHAAANMVCVAAANRLGTESDGGVDLNFYGHSFVCNERGEIFSTLKEREGLLVTRIDVAKQRQARKEWGLFPDRQPKNYRDICR